MEDYKEKLKEALNSDNTDYEVVRWIEQNFPELKESEDEKIRKEILRFIQMEVEDEIVGNKWLAWLEKKGEQKPVVRKFRIGDTIKHKSGDDTYYTIVDIVNDSYMCNNNHSWSISSQDYFELVEQKPVEWNIFDYRTWQYIVSDVLTKKNGIGQYLDNGECKKIAKYMQEEWSKKLSVEQMPKELLKGENYGIDGLYAAIDILQKTLGEVEGYQTDDGILEHKCTISAVKELSKQNHAWSEERALTTPVRRKI